MPGNMLGFVILISTLLLSRGVPPIALDVDLHCELANDEADRVLATSNDNIRTDGRDEFLVDLYGFEKGVSLYVFGWELPVSVVLTVSNGTLTGMDTMKRSGDAIVCSSTVGTALDGLYEYGPELGFRYDVAKARFLHWEIQGELIFKTTLRTKVILFNTTTDCRDDMIKFEEQPQNQYYFMTEKNWKSILISKLLTSGLQAKEQLPLMSQVVLWAQATIFKYFTDAWCQQS